MSRTTRTLILFLLLLLGPLATSAAELRTLDSAGLDRLLESHRGKVVLVDYWATWCPPCRTDAPVLRELYQRYRDDGLVILGVSMDRDQEAVEEFMRDYRIPYPVYLAGDDLRRRERIMLLPTTVLLDPEGEVTTRHQGGVSPDRLEEEIRSLLHR